MAFTVLLHLKAAKELEGIDKPIRKTITEKLKELRSNPEGTGKRLRFSDFWSLRVSDYRTIYEIDAAKKQAVVLFIGHRKKVYDNFSAFL